MHRANEGEYNWILESTEEHIKAKIGNTGRGKTMQDRSGPVKKFRLYPKSKENHEWEISSVIRFTYQLLFTRERKDIRQIY